jgi:hypothetical protein
MECCKYYHPSIVDTGKQEPMSLGVGPDKDFQKIRQPTTGEKRRLGDLGNSRPF